MSVGTVSTDVLNYISHCKGRMHSRQRQKNAQRKEQKPDADDTQGSKCQKVLRVKMSTSGPLWSSFPLPLNILLSGAQTEPAWSVLLPLSGLGSDKTMLSTWSGQCYAENLVYGPSTEYASIPIAHDSRDGAGLQQPLCWYQESCRRGVTAIAEASCLSDTGGERVGVYSSLLLCYWKISPTSSAHSCIGDVLTTEKIKKLRSSIIQMCTVHKKRQIL